MVTRTTKGWWPLALGALAVMAVLMWAPGRAHADGGTGTIAVCLTSSSGTVLTPPGDGAWYQANGGSINYVGEGSGYPVDANGCRLQTLTAGASVAVWVEYNGTLSQHQIGTVPDGSTLRFDFYTTRVTLAYGHSIAFGGPTGDSGWFTQPSMELLSDGVTPIHFRLDGTGGASARTTLLWPIATGTGATFGQTLFVLRLLDHSGNPLANGVADYYLGGWHANVGQTDANGNYVLALPNDSPYLSVAMHYDGTSSQQSRSDAVSSVFTFQTALANVELEDADGNPLDTGSVAYYAGGWQPAANTSGGHVGFEMLPGSYSFAMSYNHTGQQLNGVAITGPATDVVFQTGRLTAYFSQPFYWYKSQFYSFPSGQSMEFLPGQVGLQLPVNGCETAMFAIAAGDHLVKTGIVATLSDSANHPLAGGVATVYAAGWQPVATTSANGKTCAAVNGHLGNTAVAMVYNGTRQQISQNAQTNGIYNFGTADVAVDLIDSNGNPLDTGTASYYAGGWHTIGDTSGGVVHVEMLPGSYSFAMTYNGTRQQLNGQVISGLSDTVAFQTTFVNIELQSHTGAALNIPDNGAASYYAGGWKSITTHNANNPRMVITQMLPGTYSFALTYNGTRDQKQQAISGTAVTVYFHAALVMVQIENHDNSATLDVADNGSASYYAGGWHTIAGDPPQAEMLPGTYSFAVVYQGTRAQETYTVIEPNPNNHANALQTVTFQTGSVHSTSGTAASYYAGGWKPFINDMELLPGTYTFDFSDATPNTAETLSAGVVNTIH